ncbi:fibronectin type 3 domain-containing protein, partial [Klenkia soli]
MRAAFVVGALGVVLTSSPGADPAPSSGALRTASFSDPAPPTDVTTSAADRGLGVSWTAPGEALVSGYQVLVDGSVVTTTSGTGTSATVSGLVNGRAYTVTVRTRTTLAGTTNTGSTASSPVVGTPRDATPPAAPTGVTATRGERQVALSWTAGTEYDVDGYRVLRDGAVVTGLLAGTSHTDTGLTNDQTYDYRVQTHDTSGNWSASSAPAVSATPTDLTPPAVPTGLAAARGEHQVTLSWQPNGEADLASYRVLRDGTEIATVTSGTSYVDTGLTNDQAYAYRLVAVDTHGNRSAATAAVSATPTDLTPPAVPSGVTAVRGDGRVTVSWTADSEPDLASYRVLRNGVEVATVTGTSFTDTGLTNDSDYAYRVVAVDTHGNRSLGSTAVTATPTDLTPPAVPTGLAAVRGDGQVALSWTANTESDLASYRVLRDGTEVATVTGTAYTDSGLTNDQAYAYRLVAVDTHGNRSAASTAVTATPT